MAAIPPDTWQPPNVYLETSMGIIVLELYWKHAPKTCKNFAELARRGYYNGTKFHRIIKDFMIQGGDPTGTGRGGASIYGKQFEDELHPDLKFTGAGILAMANAGPDTNGSQFFVTLAPTQWLDGKHTIFGRVCQGIGMVNRVGMVETNSQDRPVDDVKILKAYPSGALSPVYCELVAKPREPRPSSQSYGGSFQTQGVGSTPMVTKGGGGRRGWVKVRATGRDQCRRAPEVDEQMSTDPPYLLGKPDRPSRRQALLPPPLWGDRRKPALGSDPPVVARTLSRAYFPEPCLDAPQTGTSWTKTCFPSLTHFGRTEVIDNTLNPDFVRKFIVDYFFEEKQNLRFDLVEQGRLLEGMLQARPWERRLQLSGLHERGPAQLQERPAYSKPTQVEVAMPPVLSSDQAQDFLGQAFCTLGEIVGSSGSRLEKPLTIGAFSLNSRTGKPMPAVSNGGVPGKKCGSIILSAEELSNCRDVATMQFCANKLDKKDFFGKSDPFLVFYRSNEDGTFTICHKTEVMKNTLNPVWQTFSIPVRALCNGDYDSHDFIGEFTTSYRELARGQSQFNIYEVTLLSFAVESESTFLDYIKGGTQINFTVAIDFTASNGNPSQSTSLHYMSPYQLNAYALALTAVGEIIQHYDSDKMFPALGFGAKLPPDGRVSHEFPLNGNQENPSCCGIDGILEAYHSSLRTVQLYGPTNFAPVVTHVARPCSALSSLTTFLSLPIPHPGLSPYPFFSQAAKLPMSIIIVGVGQAEFDAMVELDGDDVRISSRGKLAERDIVQFVPFRDYVDRTGNHVLSMARLARDVLAEIPDQLVSYMKAQGIRPRPPPAAPPQSPPQSPTHSPPGSPLHTHI
ncbi:hypothetical protein NN561_019071 [Cricetulus griseus]